MREESKPNVWVLDTSALFCLKQDEPGAEQVALLLNQHGSRGRIYVCFISLMEFAYILEKEEGLAKAHQGYLALKQLPLNVVESNEELALASARIKAQTPLSVADAWIAATAQRLNATLVHKDPEFEPLKGQIHLAPLPYTPSRRK